MKRILAVVLLFIVDYAISWAIVVGIIKLITMCFSIEFSLLFATGIWLILCLLELFFRKPKGSDEG